MDVSVVICTYALDLFDHLVEAVESVRDGTYENVEVVVVVDGNDELCERVRAKYGEATDVVVHCNDENLGLSASRNNGIDRASGDVVAFMDDDAVADPEWVSRLVSVYRERDAIAVGGPMEPAWVDGRPKLLPEEFYYLVGVTHDGFAEAGEEVRNTYGSNISFRRAVLEDLGGFDSEMGRQGDANLQSEESELGARMRAEYGQGVVYNPDAVVTHKVFGYRTEKGWLARRAFWQGYSKRAMATLAPAATGEETEFLVELFGTRVPRRIWQLVRRPTVAKGQQLLALFLLTGLVGAGYLYGFRYYR
jgi:glycosyltransferase involved in cell wall biosynthesis